MSARLHGPDADAVARDEWGLPLDQALARVNHLLWFWSETLGPYPAPGETYMRFGRDGEQIEDFAHMLTMGGGESCAWNDECTYPGGADDYPDVGSGFTCYWVADSSDTGVDGYWLCLRG